MANCFHPHAKERMRERGALFLTPDEAVLELRSPSEDEGLGDRQDEEERQRLKQILKACKLPESVGLIARTVAEKVTSKLWPFRRNLPGEVEH